MTKLPLSPQKTTGLLAPETSAIGLAGGSWYESPVSGEGLIYAVTPGALADFAWLTCDCLTDLTTDLALVLELFQERQAEPFVCRFTLLPRAQARLRLNLEAVKMNRWRYHREGACLKPTISGRRVELQRVNRIQIRVLYKGPVTARWCMTPLRAEKKEPAELRDPLLPRGPLLDELGQAVFRDWQSKTGSVQEMMDRLRRQYADAGHAALPEERSRWGGWTGKKMEGSGFFRTHHDGNRWWLIDPDGFYFWSAGPACVRPLIESNIRLLQQALSWLPDRKGDYAMCFKGEEEEKGESENFDYLAANFIRAFGPKEWKSKWCEMIYPQLRELGFNTCGNWSDGDAARAAQMPYVLPMAPTTEQAAPRIFRDFPDVFAASFEREAEAFAAQLYLTASDPALIGYFLMNEPQWAFTDMLLAEGMMWNCPEGPTRQALTDFLRNKYRKDATLARAWQMDVVLAEVQAGTWSKNFTEAALADLREFSTVMVRRYYELLSAACRKADPHHLNLGARFSSAPKDWIVDAMGTFDVFSINCYKAEADERLAVVCERLRVPALIGEWHYGALDVGLPAPGIGHVADQAARGQAYRYYVESSAARSWCVGAHWFTLYDQSALGRGDGENYNIGFIDVCHRLYEPLAEAARKTHECLYEVAAGSRKPFSDAPEIVERLNM